VVWLGKDKGEIKGDGQECPSHTGCWTAEGGCPHMGLSEYFLQISYSLVKTILGWKRVPATRVAMARSWVWLAKTLTWRARCLSRRRQQVPPLRFPFPAEKRSSGRNDRVLLWRGGSGREGVLRGFDFLQGVGLGDVEFGDGGAAEGFERRTPVAFCATGRIGLRSREHRYGQGELLRKDDFGMEEGAGDAGGDGEQVGLAGEDFDLAGAGEFGEVDGASAADAGGGGFVGGDGGKLGQELARVDEERF
jgi:hypothetical protein